MKIGEALQLQTILNLDSNLCKQLGVAGHVTTEQSSWNQKNKMLLSNTSLYASL